MFGEDNVAAIPVKVGLTKLTVARL